MIYFIQDRGSLAIKIGYTAADTPDSRAKALQTGNPSELVILATADGDLMTEAALHQRFAGARIAGEWFRPVPELLRLLTQPPEETRREKPAPWPLTIYLAGKISKNDWRNSIVSNLGAADQDPADGIAYNGDCPYPPDPLPANWPVLRGAIFGTHHYCGPFFIRDDHGCYHGHDSHGVCARGGRDETHPDVVFRPAAVQRLCNAGIAAADVVFAWVDQLDAYGTVAEIGYAAALGKRIWVAGPRQFRDMWFVYQYAELLFTWNAPDRCLSAILDKEAERRGLARVGAAH